MQHRPERKGIFYSVFAENKILHKKWSKMLSLFKTSILLWLQQYLCTFLLLVFEYLKWFHLFSGFCLLCTRYFLEACTTLQKVYIFWFIILFFTLLVFATWYTYTQVGNMTSGALFFFYKKVFWKNGKCFAILSGKLAPLYFSTLMTFVFLCAHFP